MRIARAKRWLRSGAPWGFIALMLAPALMHRCAHALNPDRKISQYAHSAWRLQDGFLGSAASTVTQTTDGYIWVGTLSGIRRFDGVQFSDWNPSGGDQLRSALVYSLLGTSDGSLWIGTRSAGLWQWKNGQLTQYPLAVLSSITQILEGENGSVWISLLELQTGTGSVCNIKSGRIRCYGETEGLPNACCDFIAKGDSGYLWIVGQYEAIRWKPDTLGQRIFRTPHTVLNARNVDTIAVASNEDVWVGLATRGKGAGLQHFSRGKWSSIREGNWDSSSIEVASLLLDRHQVLWVGTAGQGLYRVHDGQLDHFGSQDGLSGDYINKTFEDHEGNVWVATMKGLDCFKNLAVATFSRREGLSTDEVDTVMASRDGTVWIGGDEALNAIQGGRIKFWNTRRGLPGVQVTSLFEDQTGHLLVGIDNQLFILKDGIFAAVKRPGGRPLGFVVGMSGDADNNVWAEISGNPRELLKISNYQVKQVSPDSQIPGARTVAIDSAGSLWLGLMSGDLARYSHGKLDTFHYPQLTKSYVNAVSVSRDGSVLGATHSGLIGWLAGKQQMLTVQNGLPCHGVNAFVRDNQEALWLYMDCGLVQIPDQELKRWWRDPAVKVNVRIFDSIDGVQPGLAPFQSAARSPDGKLWFANASVLQMIDPDHLFTNAILPPVHVEEIKVGQSTLYPADGLSLPSLTRNISIRYSALSFVAPQKVLFRYILEGQDKEWQDAGARREAFYTNLAPRTYRFRVIACNNNGLWNQVGDTFSFTIMPAYYQTKWFLSLCVLATVGLLSLLYAMRLKQAHQQMEQKMDARLEERERISRELHDTLLQGVQGLILRFQAVLKTFPVQDPRHQMLENALDRADEIVLEGRQSVRDLRGRSDGSQKLAEVVARCGEELAESYPIAFGIRVLGIPSDLNPIVFDEAYRIVREALVNAFQHSSAVKIEVEIAYSRSDVCLRVRDDGVGMPADILNAGRAGHWGLSGMRERSKKIGSRLNIRSSAGAGTELELRISSSIAYRNDRKETIWHRMARRR